MYGLALLIGMVAGLRTFTAPAAISWAAWSGRLALEGSWLAFLGYAWTPWIFTLLALGGGSSAIRTAVDAQPHCADAIRRPAVERRTLRRSDWSSRGALLGGLLAGIAGAVIGTLGGHAFRQRLASVFKKDPPAAFIEDAISIGGAWLIFQALS